MSDLRLYSVNWLDGMLISQKHLKDQEKYFEELIRWHARGISDCYGLVKKNPSGRPALSMNMSISGNHLRVELIRCQVLTQDGNYIEINEATGEVIRADATVTEPIVPVYIGVDPSVKRQVGEPDPSEDLPRVPYLITGYLLTLDQPPNLPESQYVKIAELAVENGEVAHSDKYFPPCLTLSADDRLAQKAIDFKNRLENLLSLSSRAYAAITAGGSLASESTNLQLAFKDTMHHLAGTLASAMDGFLIGRNADHPIHLVVGFKRLFRVFTTLLNLQPLLKDYLNEKFFTRELNSEVSRFVSSVENFLMAEYDHNAIGRQIYVIEEILGIMRGILGFLAQTKKDQLGDQAVATESLTYRGRTYRLFDYSSNRTEQVGELCYLMIEMAEPRPLADTTVLLSKDLFEAAEWRNMQVRLGLNDARGLGETDPVDVDTTTFGNKVALHPQDVLRSSSVRQVTLIFRGAGDVQKLAQLGKMDLIVYAV
ncbi:MAG: hypothetical protein JSV44_12700 [Candidatus Zixiibacteriota bacterium]|nr:MAG: hypothetical protein JSV44_12700 [candidate division Zixibacteria bacterium]